MKIYDTLKGELVEFKPIKEKEVKMYVCGPTVYNLIHVGNGRPMIVFDAFRRFLEYTGYKVTMVQNFTDIDDKIINKAIEENVPFEEVSERYITQYWKDAQNLNIRASNFHPKTTNYVQEIIKFIEDLIKKGYAYESNGDVYFEVRKFKDYGKLSHRNIDDMKSGARIEVSDIKKDPLDFALWKNAKPGEPAWESPWGNGRPGWHIECSVMSGELLGETFDIHAGGNDLVFPHHENERAQSMARHGKEFANYWMHNGMIKVSGDKMSKSIGNIWLIRDVVKEFGADTTKVFILSKHYRTPLDFTKEGLEEQKKSVTRVQNSLIEAEKYFNGTVPFIKNTEYMKQTINNMKEALSEDFNTPKVIAKIFEVSKNLNKAITEKNEQQIKENYHLIKNEMGPVLGIFEKNEVTTNDSKMDKVMEVIINTRKKAKKEKNYEMSDYIREELKKVGIILKDTPQGMEYTIQ
ncbi:cysteine--tRNA ligase [Tepiditoga spiralis]|uniref:Cysteine--tRNA ligase n=1 Tax=Tepiditoga spiralis TaxID=2108365 RepID=A0A7G1GAA6_9BACT|nr:cysteine--tRNA ligase [Tepiditoga spiralis]BBE30359.1 cysteine--tRNA ligase [Tepiditoga spiralis]